jgi:hypothetical protein
MHRSSKLLDFVPKLCVHLCTLPMWRWVKYDSQGLQWKYFTHVETGKILPL